MPQLSWTRRRAAAAAAAALLALLLAVITGGSPARATSQQTAAAVPAMNCDTSLSVPVTVGGSSTVMTGHLCSRGNPAGKTLIYAVAGATYSWDYWAWPQDPSRYSFASAATLAGYAVLALDQPGTPPQDGVDGWPAAADLTIQNDAVALHELINAVSGGFLGGVRYPVAVLAGHSLGSDIALTEAATFHDPSIKGVDLTGYTHTPSSAGNTEAINDSYLASSDPKFAGDGLPTDGQAQYITIRPGDRGALFYSAADADPAVISEDEALKTTTTTAEVSSQGPAEDPALTEQIKVPVDLVVGENDLLYCSTADPCTSTAVLLGRERADFGSAAHLQGFVLPHAGHSINLARNAPLAFAQELLWMRTLPGVTARHN